VSTVGLLCTISLRPQLMQVVNYTAPGHPNRGVQDMHRKWSQVTPQAISVVFGELFGSLFTTANRSLRVASDISVFSIIIFASYSIVDIWFSSISRTILADVTAHFIMTMILQTLVLLFLLLVDVGHRPLPIFILLTHSPLGYNEPISSYVRTPPA